MRGLCGCGYACVPEEKPQNDKKGSIDTVANVKTRQGSKARRRESKGDIRTSESEKKDEKDERDGQGRWRNTNHTELTIKLLKRTLKSYEGQRRHHKPKGGIGKPEDGGTRQAHPSQSNSELDARRGRRGTF